MSHARKLPLLPANSLLKAQQNRDGCRHGGSGRHCLQKGGEVKGGGEREKKRRLVKDKCRIRRGYGGDSIEADL